MIDIGVNLTNSRLIHQASDVLNRAKEAGVDHCVITGTDLEASKKALSLVECHQSEFPNMLSCTAGVHPHDAKDWSPNTHREIADILEQPAVGAVGETGLDFNRNYSPKEKQIEAFEAHIELAAESGKPLFLHERDAFTTQIDILRCHRDSFENAVLHCFTGDKKALFAYLDLNLHIGITGWVCDERRGIELANIVSNIPLDRLMVETDAPYLLPRNITPKPKSRTCEPAHLLWVVEKLSDCYGLQKEEIAKATMQTAKEFFKLS